MVYEVMVPVFLMTLVGYIIGKLKKINLEPLIFLIIYITAPCLAFASLLKDKIEMYEFFNILISSFAVVFGLMLLTYIFFKLTNINYRGLYLPIMFGNNGFIGLPVVLFAFGDIGLSKAIIYVLGASVLIYSLGVYMASKKSDVKEIFRIPLIYGVLLGMAVNLLNIAIPDVILKPIDTIGQVTIPLALIVLGYQITQIKLDSWKIGIVGTIFRIGGGVLIGILITSLLGITGVTRNVVILESAMPAAVMALVICEKYKRDVNAVASTVLISTLVSIFTIPLILSLL